MQHFTYGESVQVIDAPWSSLDHDLRAANLRSRDALPLRAVVCVTVHIDGPSVDVGRKQFPVGPCTAGRYAIRRGVPRHLEILSRHAVLATFFACGYDVEHYPWLFHTIIAQGHEIAAHGYVHESWDVGDEEPTLLAKTHNIIRHTLGITPIGWCSPSGRKSHRTLPALRSLGYCYDSSEKDRDHPYLPDPAQPDFIILPNNTVSLDDYPLYLVGHSLAAEVYDNWVAEFEALRQSEGYVHLTVHPKADGGSGTPARAAVLDRFLAYLKAQPDVYFMTLAQLARHCLKDPEKWSTA